ncbi:MAG: hypothetical protein K6L73_04640 [Cellvibrionaceae bacterium]
MNKVFVFFCFFLAKQAIAGPTISIFWKDIVLDGECRYVTRGIDTAALLFDPFFTDMAVTIMGGLAFATILTLVAVPVLYSLLFNVRFK